MPGGEATSLTATASATTVPSGTPVTFAGDLIRSLDGTGLPGRPVQVYSRPAGATTCTPGGTVTTDAAGHYAAAVSTTVARDFQLLYPGDRTMAASMSPVVRVSPPAASPVMIYLHKNRTAKVRKGTKVMVYGHIKQPALTGRYVKLYKRPCAGGRWAYVRRTQSLAPTGWYSTTVQPRRSTTYKAVSYASSAFRAGTSNIVTVRVRETPGPSRRRGRVPRRGRGGRRRGAGRRRPGRRR